MIRDLLDADSDLEIAVDLCIVGAGAAGITLACAFANTVFSVCLVESGGFELEEETQRLCEGESIGLPHSGMEVGRLRYFGGTTNHWGGRCTHLERSAFKPRSWVPFSGWPIEPEELEPYYEAAWSFCGLSPLPSESDALAQYRADAPRFRQDWMRFQVWKFTPGKFPWSFGRVHSEKISGAPNVTALLHANLTRINASPDARRVDSVSVASLSGITGRIRAQAFVLCCGAIENARLLLAACEGETRLPWNGHDVIGRFYMEHLRGIGAVMMNPKGGNVLQSVLNYFQVGSVRHLLGLSISAEAQRRYGLLCGCAVLDYQGDLHSGVAAGQAIWRGLKEGRWVDDLGEKVGRVIRDVDDIVGSLHRRVFERRRPIMPLVSATIILDVEQAPNPESRISLSRDCDALSLPKARVCWRLSELEYKTARSSRE